MTQDNYVGGYGHHIISQFSQRSFHREGAFFKPYVKSGMRILDCGCGPGTMSVEIAQITENGLVTGIDLDDTQFAVGTEAARQLDVTNVEFRIATIYQLPFEDHTFDAIFAHAVLYHLKDPLQGVLSLKRVLKPGGFLGVRDHDHMGDIYAPTKKSLSAAWKIIEKIFEYNQSNFNFGREQRAVMRQAGLKVLKVTASYDMFASPEERQSYASFWIDFIGERYQNMVLEQGWATNAELKDYITAFQKWAKDPDGLFARARCECVAQK